VFVLISAYKTVDGNVQPFLEETKDYNIHIHAIISCNMTDYIKRFTFRRLLMDTFRNKNWGKIKDIQPVSNYDSWAKYIIKDVHTDREYNPIIRDDYALLLTVPNVAEHKNIDINQIAPNNGGVKPLFADCGKILE